jgi:hypothetical protein
MAFRHPQKQGTTLSPENPALPKRQTIKEFLGLPHAAIARVFAVDTTEALAATRNF